MTSPTSPKQTKLRPIHNPNVDHADLDDIGDTYRTLKQGDKKLRGEGTSHWIAHAEDNDQRTERKAEKVPVKKNAEVPVRLQKNHPPDKAKKMLEVTQGFKKGA
ncbi:uncharacterized protein PFL1_06388 [Pseudozyma flocculosa PF-1]|uniref:Uncharacterized protein n=2 Tax=Pseudozyma flocculosa TaxID=84751 RepID=A0A5C3F7Q8_9BASI|nr:uncharacterized protein PFL1_06388 [Pseudozyma flocculosa PF-1]EPQ26181.1 hypothetical protein PFL1_06388 [Pseudozyma flocculosa PF-1]SPO40432.1 uncharacterized protein PSFLO_05914 [Pseudozyma flocculosa]